jgi:hypothetical protein
MKLKIFALRDQKIDAFMNPIAMQTPGQVVRMLQDQITNNTDKDNTLATHSEDFELFEVGEFDTQTGVLIGTPPKSIILLQDLKAKA